MTKLCWSWNNCNEECIGWDLKRSVYFGLGVCNQILLTQWRSANIRNCETLLIFLSSDHNRQKCLESGHVTFPSPQNSIHYFFLSPFLAAPESSPSLASFLPICQATCLLSALHSCVLFIHLYPALFPHWGPKAANTSSLLPLSSLQPCELG